MAKKTNCTVNGKDYYRICRKVGKKLNKCGVWVDDYRNFYGASKREAEEKYNTFMQRKDNGVVSGKCLGELIQEWIDNIFSESKLATGTKYGYIRSYQHLFTGCSLAGRMIDEVSAMDLQLFYNQLIENGSAAGSVKHMHNLLVRFYKYVELNGIGRNITTSVTVPNRDRAPAVDLGDDLTIWSDKDIRLVINALSGTTMRFVVVLAVNTGARISELLALTYDDIHDNLLYINKQLSEKDPDGKTAVPHLDKTKSINSNRVIPLSDAVLREYAMHKLIHQKEMLKNGYRTSNIFTTGTGTYYYKRNVTRSLQRLYKRIGVRYRKFHAFRHTFGTNLSRAGVPIEETCKLMGHSSINVTMKYYIHVDAQRRLDAVEKIAAFSL